MFGCIKLVCPSERLAACSLDFFQTCQEQSISVSGETKRTTTKLFGENPSKLQDASIKSMFCFCKNTWVNLGSVVSSVVFVIF